MPRNSESLAEKAYDMLEGMILRAELPPGAWIAEKAVAERVGLGRTPVREALQRLARHYLVEIVTGRGLRVTDLDVRDQLLILELRREVEPLLVRRAVRHATEEERAELGTLAAAMQAQREEPDATDFFQHDLAFKLLLLRCAKNRFAAEAITPLWLASRRFAWMYRSAGDVKLVADLLCRLIAAIRAGDEQGAVEATGERMEYLDRFARATLLRRPETPAA